MKSTMLGRLENMRRRGGPRLPRKGMIRIVVLILMLGLTIRFLAAPKKSDTGSPPTPSQAPAAPVAPNYRARRIPDKKPETRHDTGPASLGNRLDEKALSGLLLRSPHSITRSVDTVALRRQTLVVHSSIDSSLQTLGQRLLSQYRPRYGALVALEPGSGRIRALVSYTHDSVPWLGDRLYCRSVFPAASIFKTITAAAALEQAHMTPESCLPLTGRRHTLYFFQLRRELGNFDEVTLEEAFAYSINPVFGRIGLYHLHTNALREYGKAFGLGIAVPFILPTEASDIMRAESSFAIAELASGFNRSTTLSPLVGALIAAAVVEDGGMPVPVLVDSVVDIQSGRNVYTGNRGVWRSSVKPETAVQLRRLMSKVTHYGTARKSFRYIKASHQFRDLEYGGKTGSVNKDTLGKVDWFVGYVRHPEDVRQRLAVSVVTTHGEYWTVQSSFLAAEIIRNHIRGVRNEPVGTPASARSQKPTAVTPDG